RRRHPAALLGVVAAYVNARVFRRLEPPRRRYTLAGVVVLVTAGVAELLRVVVTGALAMTLMLLLFGWLVLLRAHVRRHEADQQLMDDSCRGHRGGRASPPSARLGGQRVGEWQADGRSVRPAARGRLRTNTERDDSARRRAGDEIKDLVQFATDLRPE